MKENRQFSAKIEARKRARALVGERVLYLPKVWKPPRENKRAFTARLPSDKTQRSLERWRARVFLPFFVDA